MNISLKSLKIPVFLIACILIYNSCTTSKNGTKIKITKSWVAWKIQFKAGAGDEDIAKAKIEIDKYINDHIKEYDRNHDTVLVITTNNQIDYSDKLSGPQLIIKINLGINEQRGVRGPTPPPPPPPTMPYTVEDLNKF